MGPIVSVDPSIGAFIDTLNPLMMTKFLAAGKLFHRAYQAYISTVGIKIEAAIRLQAIFLFRSPFKKLYYHEEIELGRGVDIVVSGICHITWASFKGN
jgi:hypothetical protein